MMGVEMSERAILMPNNCLLTTESESVMIETICHRHAGSNLITKVKYDWARVLPGLVTICNYPVSQVQHFDNVLIGTSVMKAMKHQKYQL